MTRKRTPKSTYLRVRLTPHAKEKLYAYAARHECTVTHVLTEYIRRLPNEPLEAAEQPDGLAA